MNSRVAFCALLLFQIPAIQARDEILNESLASIQAKALGGDVHYQGVLALFHKFGEKGLSVDLLEAERWARLSAEKEGSLGLCALAALELEKGNGQRGRFLYDEAYLHSNLRSVVKNEDPIALFCMGMMEIDNPPRNFTKGIRHLRRSAEMGFATAQATLGMIYFTGIGVKKDPERAIKWCAQAAGKKLPLGMFYLGMAYSVGDGIQRNDDYAMRWIRASADRQLTMAQLTLGMKLATGDGTKKNMEQAVEWLRRAAIQGGSAEAKLQLRRYENLLMRMRNPPAAYVPDEQEKSAIQLAQKKIMPSIHDRPTPPPKRSILETPVLPIENEKPIRQPATNKLVDLRASNSSLKEAAFSGDFLAAKKLGLKFYAEKEFEEAKKWFEIAAIKKEPEALRYLGILYFLGQGVELNYDAAKEWFTQAVQAGDLEATRYLRIVKQFQY